MILNCTECETKFLINAEALGDKGRRVRCGNCSAVWFVKPATAAAVAEEKKVIKDQQENLKEIVKKQAAGEKPSLPAVYEPVTPPKWLKAAVIILVFINIGAFIFLNKKLIGQTAFYDTVGQYQTEGVAITDANLLPIDGKKGVKFYSVGWSAANNSKEKREFPSRRIKVLDKDLNIVSKGRGKDDLIMEPGQTIKIEPSKVINDGVAKYVVLEIGNPYELMRR